MKEAYLPTSHRFITLFLRRIYKKNKILKFVWAENSVSSIRLLSNNENENLGKTGTSGVIH